MTLRLVLQQAKGGANDFVLRLEATDGQLLAEKLFQVGSKRDANVHEYSLARASGIVKLANRDVEGTAGSGYGLGKPPPGGTEAPSNHNRNASFAGNAPAWSSEASRSAVASKNR